MGRSAAVAQRLLTAPPVIALAVWAALSAVGLAVRRALGATALTASVQVLPLALGFTLVLAVAGLLLWRGPTRAVLGVALGALGGWLSLMILVALAGTPYGVGGLFGDCGRTLVAAQRYTETWRSADGFLVATPGQYPPLYFWVWGRLAALRGSDAWQLMAPYQGLAIGLVPIAAASVWRLGAGSWLRSVGAAARSAAVLLVGLSVQPCKTHEFAAFAVGVPLLVWASTAVHTLCSGASRIRPATALAWGATAGVVALTYQLPILFGLPPLLVLWAVWAVRAKAASRVLLHLLLAASAAFAVTAWYVVPFARALLESRPAPRAEDLTMVYTSLSAAPGLVVLPAAVAVVCAAGMVVATALRRSAVAQTLLALVAGAVVVQAAALWNVVRGGETLYSYKTGYLVAAALAAAVVVLAPWRHLPEGGLRAAATRPASAALAVLLIGPGLMYGYWSDWRAPMVGLDPTARATTYTTAIAYAYPLPDCEPVPGWRAPLDIVGCVPADEIAACVSPVLGPDELPVALSSDDRTTAFLGWYQVLPTTGGASGPLDEWEQRLAFVEELAASSTSAQLLAAAAAPPYGPVHVFVLSERADGDLVWTAQRYRRKVPVVFDRELFAGPGWVTCQAGPLFVAVVRPA